MSQNENPEQVPEKESGKESTEEILKIHAPITCAEKHFFIYKTANTVECTKCPVGYQLPPLGAEVKNGRVLIHGQIIA